jgi:hypothetical protein
MDVRIEQETVWLSLNQMAERWFPHSLMVGHISGFDISILAHLKTAHTN